MTRKRKHDDQKRKRRQRNNKQQQPTSRAAKPHVAQQDPYAGDAPRVYATLERLRQRDPRCHGSGAARHRYRLGPPLDEAVLARFESAFAVEIPDDYRSFLKHVGNGGPGPGAGLNRLNNVQYSYAVAGRLSIWLPLTVRPDSDLRLAESHTVVDDYDDEDYDDGDDEGDDDLEDASAADNGLKAAGEDDSWSYPMADRFPPELADLVAERSSDSWFFPEDEEVLQRLLAAYASAGEGFRSIDLLEAEYLAREWEDSKDDEGEPSIGEPLLYLSREANGGTYLALSGPARGTVWLVTERSGAAHGAKKVADSFREYFEAYLSYELVGPFTASADEGALDPGADGDDVLRRARATSDDPQMYIDLYVRGQVLGDWEGLLATFQYIRSQSSPSSLLAHLQGNVLTALGRHAEAVVELRQALDMAPSHEDAVLDGWLEYPQRDLADNLEMLGRFEEALGALEEFPPYSEKFLRVGRICIQQGRIHEAIDACGVARFLANLTNREFTEAEALNVRGDALRRLGRLADARRDYERALYSQDPSRASRNLAALACTEGNPEQALVHLRRALRQGYRLTDYLTDPDFAPARALAGFEGLVARASWQVPR